MKLILDKTKYSVNPVNFLRKAGYGIIRSRHTGSESFVRHFGAGRYPRFHIYFLDKADRFILNLHLDQKAPSYQGVKAHNAEDDSEPVMAEIERLKQLADSFLTDAPVLD